MTDDHLSDLKKDMNVTPETRKHFKNVIVLVVFLIIYFLLILRDKAKNIE